MCFALAVSGTWMFCVDHDRTHQIRVRHVSGMFYVRMHASCPTSVRHKYRTRFGVTMLHRLHVYGEGHIKQIIG